MRWKISLEKLKDKTGSTSSLKKFRYFIRQIEKHNHLPDYSIRLNEEEMVIFSPRTQFVEVADLPRISHETLEKGKRMVELSSRGWDFGEIHSQFSKALLDGKFKPENANGAFIGFVKKKIKFSP